MEHGNQHTVPASYLNAWCDPTMPEGQEPYVWVFPKDGSPPRRKAPKNIFHEREFYTINKADGSRDLVLEHGLSELEGLFVKLRRDKLSSRVPLAPEDKLLLYVFTAAMQERTKAARDRIKEEWQPIHETIDGMKAWLKTATPEQVKQFAESSLSIG